MNYPEMQRDILEEFAEFRPGLPFGDGFSVIDQTRQNERCRTWRAANPAKVRASAARTRAKRGQVAGQLGRPARAIRDQHGNTYSGGKDVEARTGVKVKTVWKILRGERKSSGGYCFTWIT